MAGAAFATVPYTAYVVEPGDTLWDIGKKYDVPYRDIMKASRLTSSLIYPGDHLEIPYKGASSFKQSDLNLMARIVHAEAMGEISEGKVGVAAVILNRIDDPHFPDTLAGVIFQKWAFSVVDNGAIWLYEPDISAHMAVQEALAGWDPTGGATFFYNPYFVKQSNWIWSRPVTTTIGQHVFAV